MARAAASLALLALLALAFTNSATATLGKGKLLSKGKGISFATQCQDVCKDKCRKVPAQVCADVAVPYKECSKVPVVASVKRCGKVCSAAAPVVATTEAVAFGKGKGKGRHLLTKGKGLVLTKPSISCDTVCEDVPVTRFETQCEAKVRTVQSCKKVHQQVCEPVCRQRCVKVPVMVQAEPVHVQPVMLSKGKGKGL